MEKEKIMEYDCILYFSSSLGPIKPINFLAMGIPSFSYKFLFEGLIMLSFSEVSV